MLLLQLKNISVRDLNSNIEIHKSKDNPTARSTDLI